MARKICRASKGDALITDVQECGKRLVGADASPEGETNVAQGGPGSPSHAAFARVGVVEPWVRVDLRR